MRWRRTTWSESSDDELVRAVVDGRRDAYAELVRRHQDVIYRHACGLGIEHDSAVDLVQDAFVKAYSRITECRDRAHFRAWLFRIARNLCLDYLKNVRRSCAPLSRLPNAHEIPNAAEPDVELAATLQQALDHLPMALREAFLLKHDAGYTYDEIADLTSASPSAVKMRVHRAREALQLFLSRSGLHAA